MIFDVLTGRIVQKLSGHTETVRDLDWHPEMQTLVSTGWDGRVIEWTWSPGDIGLSDIMAQVDDEGAEDTEEEEDGDWRRNSTLFGNRAPHLNPRNVLFQS